MRLRPSPDWEPLFEGLARVRSGWPSRGFSWDNRLVCVTSSFTGEFAGTAKAALGMVFSQTYTHKTVASAHSLVREVAETSGGVRANQLVFASAPEPQAGLLFYGLWWPWNDQETVSVRLGIAGLDANDEPYGRFRDVFNVSVY